MRPVQPSLTAPTEELRFAVVLNGGVSLAVWMGGVCAEIHDLTHAKDVYGRLLDLLQASARADVIAGTSAGGINGAFLALGQAYQDADLGSLLELWTERGSFEELLRSPIRGDHSSLLRGDDYFLPELEKAFRGVIRDRRRTDPEERPIELFLTCTNLAGELHPFADALGQSLWEVEHTGLFRFSRDPRRAGMARDGDDLVDGPVARRLALAARCTASFPGAFEPVFVPVHEPRPSTAADGNALPDMEGIATFSRSRFVIDGGVLRNEPIAPALAAIWRLPAEAQVRRVLLYVNPDPAPAGAEEPARQKSPPKLRDVLLASLTRLTMQQSVHEELRQIEESNARARHLKDAKPNLIAALPADIEDEQLEVAFNAYRDLRATATARRLAQTIADEWFRSAQFARDGSTPPPIVPSPSEAWRTKLAERSRSWLASPSEPDAGSDDVCGRNTLRDALEVALGRAHRQPDGSYDLPWIPTRLAGPRKDEPWSWGLAPIERLLAFALDQLKRAQVVANRSGDEAQEAARAQARAKLRDARWAVHEQLRILRAIRHAEDAYWRAWARSAHAVLDRVVERGSAPGLQPLLQHGIDAVIDETEQMVLDVAAHNPPWEPTQLDKRTIAQVALAQLRVAAEVVSSVPVSPEDEEPQHVKATLQGLAGGPDLRTAFASSAQIGRRLLVAEVYVSLAGLDRPADEQQEVALALISGNARSRWAPSMKPGEKIAGLKLAHFGAFYKRSWRVNDWLWGRVDGASRLCEVLLDPKRLWQLGCTADQIREVLDEVLANPPAARPEDAPTRDAALQAELDEYERQRTSPEPAERTLKRLPCTSAWFATARHRRIIDKEAIETLAKACLADVRNDTAKRAHGAMWAQALSEQPGESPDHWLDQLRQAQIGAETFEGELGTDQLSRTVAVVAANTTATLKSVRAGLGSLRFPMRALHGIALLLYALVESWSGGRVGAAVANLAIALGGAFLAVVALATQAAPPWLTTAGTALVLAGLTAAALRSRMRTLATLTGPPVLFVACYLVLSQRSELPRSWTPALVVLGLVVAAWVLGFASEPQDPPRLGHLRAVGKVLAEIISLGVTAWIAWVTVQWLNDRIDAFATHPLDPIPSVCAAVVVIGFGFATSCAWRAVFVRRRGSVRASRAELDDAQLAVAWLPWYGVPFGVAAVAVAYALGWNEATPLLRALFAAAALSWIVPTLAWPAWIVVRPRRR